MKKRCKYILLLLACIGSRLLSTIYYVEDIDSLRFALAVYDYDVAHLRPHFPAYPVYCFLAKMVYALTHSLALSFSLIGGLSLFVIIYSCLQIGRYFVRQQLGQWKIIMVLLLFFNPFLWIMSNRYMPDLMGLALTMLAFKYFIYTKNPLCAYPCLLVENRHPPLTKKTERAQRNTKKILVIYWVLVGLLAGTRLSYLPVLLVPALILLYTYPKMRIKQLFSFSIGLSLWFVPLWVDTGWENLIQVATKQTVGHFYEWGGTVLSEHNTSLNRFLKLCQTIWADGLGGYWKGRHWLTGIWSIFLGIGLIVGFRVSNVGLRFSILSISLFIYGIWVFFYQNIVYKARHILPFIPFVLMWISFGWHQLIRIGSRARFVEKIELKRYIFLPTLWGPPNRIYAIGLFGLLLNVLITGILIQQHRQPTAIAQFKDYLVKQGNEQAILYSIPLVHFYIQQHQQIPITHYLSLDQPLFISPSTAPIYSTVRLDSMQHGQPKQVLVFYHNPYVNRLWSELWVYVYVENSIQ